MFTNDLTAMEGVTEVPFKFEYDSSTGKYGYRDGADTFCPFSDGDGGLSEEVLWINPSPTSALSSTVSINCNFSKYKYILIKTKFYTNNDTMPSVVGCYISSSFTYNDLLLGYILMGKTLDSYLYRRSIYARNNGTLLEIVPDRASAESYSYNIPLEIVGITDNGGGSIGDASVSLTGFVYSTQSKHPEIITNNANQVNTANVDIVNGSIIFKKTQTVTIRAKGNSDNGYSLKIYLKINDTVINNPSMTPNFNQSVQVTVNSGDVFGGYFWSAGSSHTGITYTITIQ
jgi:hypothetical protein